MKRQPVVYSYEVATPEARAAYDAASAVNVAAWKVYDAAARRCDPEDAATQVRYRNAWQAYRETLGPLDQATAALHAPAAAEPEAELTLW